MARPIIDRTGETYTTKDGYLIKIVEYRKYIDLVVEFQDEHKARVHTNLQACQIGSVRNPYHPYVYGVGYLGLNDDGTKVVTQNGKDDSEEYKTWHRMMERCYSETSLAKNPSYLNVKVCERWHCFKNFLEDLPLIEGYDLWKNNPKTYVSLDKDLKQQGKLHKTYNIDGCCFVESKDNAKEVVERCGVPNNSESRKRPIVGFKDGYSFYFKSAVDSGIANIDKVMKGQRKSAGGFTGWRFMTDDEIKEINSWGAWS